MFRPSGKLEWALACSTLRKWHFVGSINSEERSCETAIALFGSGLVDGHSILRIKWPESPYKKTGESLTNRNLQRFRAACGNPNLIEKDLLAPISDFKWDIEKLHSESVILDITSMPKRFFFYFLKSLLRNPTVKDLIITYCGGVYGHGALSSNHEDWDVLPTFRATNRDEEDKARQRLAVSVGFMPGGLHDHLRTDDKELTLYLILPFPARLSSTRRGWKSAMEIYKGHGDSSPIHICRVAPEDMSEAFNIICGIANGQPLSLAPFGPKPISAAMCIFASLTNSPVYYAQPKWYLPSYTLKTELDITGKPKITAHWIKHRGVSLYNIHNMDSQCAT